MFLKVARGLLKLAVIAGFAATMPLGAQAKPEYAEKEKVKCDFCHQNPGGPRNFRGKYYGFNKKSFDKFDEQYESKVAGVKAGSMGADAMTKNPDYPRNIKVPAALNFTVKDIDGKNVNLARYQGEVIMVVNVASKCGNTPQYASMQKLYEKYKERGLVILGFPANDFGMQEPGTNKEIKEFCEATYKVAFPMFSKITVKGDDKAPLYKFLTSKETNEKFAGEITWNFDKFLINRKGEVIARIGARTDPAKADVVKQIETALAEK